jgi:hypothetical protein
MIIKAHVAFALNARTDADFNECIRIADENWETADGSTGNMLDHRLSIIDAELSRTGDADFVSVFDGVIARERVLTVYRYGVEARRRNLWTSDQQQANWKKTVDEALGGLRADQAVDNVLTFADIESRVDPARSHAWLDRAVEIAKAQSDSHSMVDQIAEAAGKAGAYDLVERLNAETWWKPASGSVSELTLAAADGCIKAGAFDKALEYLRRLITKRPTGFVQVVGHLKDALLDADQIANAKAVHAEMGRDTRLDNDLLRFARARRGEDVLSFLLDTRAAVTNDRLRPYLIVGAAIATIGYTVAMKKRIAEYGGR